jgi:uncharacterized protein (TIGR02421 family)
MHGLVTRNKSLFEIDENLDRLVQKIELLNYINPLNIEEEKIKFFKSQYQVDPEFIYPKINFHKFNLHRAMFSLKLERIEDQVLRNLYEDIVYFYSGLIQCIETIGEGKRFYYNSLKSFGTPTEEDVENAKFILHFEDDKPSEKELAKYSALQAEELFRQYSKRYDFTYSIKFSSKMSAIAMVLNNIQTLVLNSNHVYSDSEIAILTNHEIGVHMVTTMNGLLHPLKIFSHGLPNNVETQEGLAVFSEYKSGSLNVKRLKKLAYRVIAVDSLAKGYSFSKTFRLLHGNYDLDLETAFYITLRVHRGGGFTKDYLYLSGLKKINHYFNSGGNMNTLLVGKASIEYLDQIQYLIDQQYAMPSKFTTDSFLSPNILVDQKVNFIIDGLK